jgi:hypothetical protein
LPGHPGIYGCPLLGLLGIFVLVFRVALVEIFVIGVIRITVMTDRIRSAHFASLFLAAP